MTDAVDIFLGDMKGVLHRFNPQPGDVFVLTFTEEISVEVEERLRSYWMKNFPNNEMKISVVTYCEKIELIPAESKR